MSTRISRTFLPAAVLCVLQLGASECAFAASSLQSIGHPSFGPGALTRDPISHLDWLDWSLTTNRAASEIAAELEPGGEFNGFRYATKEETIELYQHAGFISLSAEPAGRTWDYQAAVDFVSLFGLTRTFGDPPFIFQSRAFLGPGSYYLPPEFSEDDISVEVLVYYYRSDGLGFAGANGGLENPVGIGDGPDPNTGHALVREVPEPATIWLAVATAMILASSAYRGKTR